MFSRLGLAALAGGADELVRSVRDHVKAAVCTPTDAERGAPAVSTSRRWPQAQPLLPRRARRALACSGPQHYDGRVRRLFAPVHLGAFRGADLQAGTLTLALPSYGQEILELAPAPPNAALRPPPRPF